MDGSSRLYLSTRSEQSDRQDDTRFGSHSTGWPPHEARIGLGEAIALPLAPPTTIRRYVDKFISVVESARPKVLRPTLSESYYFIESARKAAYDCFTRIIRASADDFANLVGELSELLRIRRQAGDPPVVQILLEDDEYLPWEWLAEPVPRYRASTSTATRSELTEADTLAAAADVLGFAAIVPRMPIAPQPGTDARVMRYLTTHHNQVRIKFIRHISLGGASAQEGYFNAHRTNIELIGPLPATGHEVDILELLVNPSIGPLPLSHNGVCRDQVVHVHCHHEATRPPGC